MRRIFILSTKNTSFLLAAFLLAARTSIIAIFANGFVWGSAHGRDLPAPPKRPSPPLITETTASITAPPITEKLTVQAQEAGGVTPLPIASRDRMSECGKEWVEIKRSGKENNRIWREFAMNCLQN